MIYLLAILCPPGYFLLRKRWRGFILNACFYGFAWILLISVVFALFSLIPYLLAVVHAVFYLRKEMVEEAATIMASKMAEKMTAMKAGE